MGSLSMAACWTCRIRKKKCDRKRPICSACGTLGITCDQSAVQPSWMNSARDRRDFSQKVRAEIKQKSESRRKRHYVTVLPPQNGTSSKNIASKPSSPLTSNPQGFNTRLETEGNVSDQDHSADLRMDRMELHLQITFLDHVFPFFFPFYHPSIFDGGRSWVLATLRSNAPLFHTSMSLSTNFVAMAQTNMESHDNDLDKTAIWDKLATHFDTAITGIREDVDRLNIGQLSASVVRKACLMESVIQLLVFGTGMAKTRDAHVHIAAAASLFRDIFDTNRMNDGRPDLQVVLEAMERPVEGSESSSYSMCTPEQGAFRFFVAILLYVDIISATAFGCPPQLESYHVHLLSHGTGSAECRQALDTEAFVGIPTWVLLAITESLAMSDQRRQGNVSHLEVEQKGKLIAQRLDRGIKHLESQLSDVEEYMRPVYLYSDSRTAPERRCHSLIWAYAAKLFHFITMFGWQITQEELRKDVSQILILLQQVHSAGVLRNLAWPFCVAGCLASIEEEDVFRSVAKRMGLLQVFGTMNEALQIMEQVWERREQMDVEIWDFTHCFQISGSRTLLI